jgi:hypothetical protein
MKEIISKIKKVFHKTKKSEIPIFQKLTPINNIDLTIYQEALDFVFKNNDIKNIAISGPYSSGKSSILETYKCLHIKKKFLHISLAHFTEIEVNKDFEDSKINEPILEGKILNQLLHQIDASKIPQTDFKIKRTIPIYKIILFTLLFICSILFLLYLLKFEEWKYFIVSISDGYLENILNKTINHHSQMIAGLFILLSVSIMIYSAINAQVNKTIIKKLSFQGNNLELFDKDTESYFDKYLNEVLYIFDNSMADVIVFEDMDRYNANQIFVKLREINTLVNNRLKKQKKIIRFFYLLKDDIFINKGKTKFFDFILPIIPVIDSSNSYEQFIKLFEDGKIINRFNKYFLQELSLYIDDMRILKNIFNEYIIFNSKIGSIELDNNKLLAMIVYKNLFPRDYSALQLSKGYVYSLFSQKPIFIKDEVDELKNKIAEIDKKIEIFKHEGLRDLDELDTIFIKFPYQHIRINGTNQQSLNTNLDVVKAMKENPTNIQLYANNNWFQFDLQTVLNSLNQNIDYLNRKKLIEDKLDTNLNTLEEKKKDLQLLMSNINNENLREIITKSNIDIIFYKNDQDDKKTDVDSIRSNGYFELIIYLIRNGYIDETYHDYMTYFYQNSITREDKIFLRSITDKKAKDYVYKLKNMEVILSRLKPSDYTQEEILNFDLLSYLLKNRNKYEQFIKSIFIQLASRENIDFCIKFIDTQEEISSVLKCIADCWPNFLELTLNSTSTYENQRNKLVTDIMLNLDDKYVIKYNINNVLTNYISKLDMFLTLKCNIEHLINKLKKLSVKFVKFPGEGINQDFFNEIYKNELYQLNFYTISFILYKNYNLKNREDIVHKNYTSILSKPDERLYQYIHTNMNIYMDIILNNGQETINDDEEAIIKILNNEDINDDNRLKYIQILKSVISDINTIGKKEYWDSLIRNDCIKNTEANILSYYFENENGLNQVLIEFINAHTGSVNINVDDLDNNYGENSASKFINNIIECNELSNGIYEKIISSSHWRYNEFDKSQISNDKILILINTKTILMTEANLVFMRNEYHIHLLPFIIKNIKGYIKLISGDNVIFEELISLLEKEIGDDDKINLINKTEEKISIKSKNYSENLKIQILKNNLYQDDISYLLEIFNNETENMRNNIIEVMATNIEILLTDQFTLPYDILKLILNYKGIDYFKKRSLFAKYIQEYNNNQIRECLTLMTAYDYLQLFENKRPKILIDEPNEIIMKAMKSKKLIKNYIIDNNNKRYYRVFGNNIRE